jgi:hypothetical protein
MEIPFGSLLPSRAAIRLRLKKQGIEVLLYPMACAPVPMDMQIGARQSRINKIRKFVDENYLRQSRQAKFCS